MGEDLRQVHPESLLAFLRARLEEEFAEASEASLTSLARQYSTHPDYLDEWPSAVPGEPCQRFAQTLNDTVRPVMLIGLDELGEERANDWATWTIKAVMAVRDEELERLRLIAKVNDGLHRSAHEEADEWRERAETAEREAERMRVLFLQRCSAIERVRHVCREDKARKNAPGMWLVAEQVLAALDSQDTDRG